jgi:hypothetical protein
LFAAALLAWTTVFHAKGIELRPDVPAMVLLLLAFVVLSGAGSESSWRRLLSVGFLCGLAMLFTQKSVVPVAGIGAAACCSRCLARGPGAEGIWNVLTRVALPMLSGAAAVWGIASLLFAAAAAAGDFWYSTWYQLWIWSIRSNRWDHLRPTLAGDLTVWVAAASEICFVARRWRRAETWDHGWGAVAVIAAVCITSLPFVKATYPQFYLLWMPFLAALAGSRIAGVLADATNRGQVIAIIVAGAILATLQAVLWRRAYSSGFSGSLPRLAGLESSNAVVLLVLACAMCAIVVLALRRQGGFALFVMTGLGMTYGVLRDIDLALWSNGKQVVTIEEVNRQIAPDERVLDGFTGLAALRRHAWYYWWINEYSLALVPQLEREGALLERLKSDPPAGILFDRNVELLPADLLAWIREKYEPVDPPPLWKWKSGSDRDAARESR